MKLLRGSGGHWQVLQFPLPAQDFVAVLKGSPDQCSKSWDVMAVPSTLGCSTVCSWPFSIPTLSFQGIPSDLSIAAASLSIPGLKHHPCSLPALLAGCCGMMLCGMLAWLTSPHSCSHTSWVSRTHWSACARQNHHSDKAGKSTTITIVVLKYLKNP